MTEPPPQPPTLRGCASYGDREQIKWCLGEAEGALQYIFATVGAAAKEECQGLEHIKLAYDLGINTFDTSNLYGNGVRVDIHPDDSSAPIQRRSTS